MDEAIVKNIINVVKTSNDKSVVYKALVKLRTDLVKDREGIALFRVCGGIPPVVRLLNRVHEKILEIALSILANCCTETESCNEVMDNKITSPLITILKSIPNPIVQCRACRLLGNLAKDQKIQCASQYFSIAQALCLILEESSEIATTVMAARAARLLTVDKQFLKEFVKSDGFKILMKIMTKYMKNDDINLPETEEEIKPVGRKSCQPREKYFEEVARNLEGVRSDIFDYELLKKERKKKCTQFIMLTEKCELDLISEILKCIQNLSEMQSYVPVTELFSAGVGFPCLVFFADQDNIFRPITLKILSNFSKNHTAIPVLSSADAVISACELLTASNLEKSLTETELRHCLNIICLLSVDACNRSKIRRSGALNELIKKAKKSNSYSETALILYALNNFQYDHLSMDLLLRCGLVGVLIKELDAYMNSNEKYRKEKCEEKKRTSLKRKTECSSSICSKNQNMKIWNDLYEPESPTSSNSSQINNFISPSSPCSSRSLSPVSMSSKTFNDNDFDADTYSPVCSDNEEDTSNEECKEAEDNEVLKLLEECCKTETTIIEEGVLEAEEDDESVQESVSLKIPVAGNLPLSTIDIIDNLLLKISLQLKNRGELSKPETLKTILQAITVFGTNSNSFGTSLCNIISDSEFFVAILKQDVIYSIYKLTKQEELKQGGESLLDTLMCVGETGYGRGEIARLLTKGEPNFQKRAAIAVAFVIRTPKILHPLLTENGGLYILLNSILNKDDEYRFEAADGLTSLSQALGINLPSCDLTQFNTNCEFEESTDFPVCNEDDETENVMKFVLHRGCSKIPIKFNKKLLTENSEVFNSMLNSDFRECNEKEIQLKNTSVHGIKYFLNLINLESKKQKPNIPPLYHFDSILEAYELSRMYILEDLAKKLFSLVIYRISDETSLKIFEWALKNFNPELSEIAINYYLCSDLPGKQKVELFRKADYSEYSKEWNQMIIDAILVKCQNVVLE